jgi:hypothetical protein
VYKERLRRYNLTKKKAREGISNQVERRLRRIE